jgi:hypothetical protein
MNIFALDSDASRAAQYHNDRHCVKMILESAQLLSTAHHVLDGEYCVKRVRGVLRPTHNNHPCAVWTRQTAANYRWLHTLMVILAQEYTLRYGKVHLFGRKIFKNVPPLIHGLETLPERIAPTFMNQELTPFAQAMPIEYRRADPVEAYRLYYFYEKHHLGTWRLPHTAAPDWWIKLEEDYRKGKRLKKIARKS